MKISTKNKYQTTEDDQTASLVKNKKQIICFHSCFKRWQRDCYVSGFLCCMTLNFQVFNSACLFVLLFKWINYSAMISCVRCAVSSTFVSCFMMKALYPRLSCCTWCFLPVFPSFVNTIMCFTCVICQAKCLFKSMSFFVSDSHFCLLFASLCSGLTITGFWFPPSAS